MDEEAPADRVRERANYCCEYCRLPEAFSSARFQLDHIIAEQHGGASVDSNLALACLADNNHKGPNLAGIDPKTGKRAWLFNPRRHSSVSGQGTRQIQALRSLAQPLRAGSKDYRGRSLGPGWSALQVVAPVARIARNECNDAARCPYWTRCRPLGVGETMKR
jgi:hypothetical protein